MDDRGVIRAFVNEGARRGFGPTVHIEGDGLLLAGWWQLGFRISPNTFILREEEPPEDTKVIEELAEELAAAGLEIVGHDLPLIYPITYTEFTLPTGSWSVWSDSLVTAESALAARAGGESFFGQGAGASESAPPAGLSAELGGARRIAGLAPSMILTVGLPEEGARRLEAAMPECRFVVKAFGEITPDGCGTLIPTVLVVDAGDPTGVEFIMEHRASACGRFIPTVAVTSSDAVPLGADIAVGPDLGSPEGVEAIRGLLP